jgi:heat shock protein HslJ
MVESIGEHPVIPSDQKPLQLVLSEHDNRVAAQGGVNRFGGSYEVEGDRLRFGPMMSTKMAGPPELNRQEAAFAEVLDEANAYQLAGDQLILLKDGQPLMKLKAKP